ncbi:MAG: hypothetical protein WCQ65_09955 [Fermentimonas sp.]
MSPIREYQVKDSDFLSPWEHDNESQHYFYKLADVPTYSGTSHGGKFIRVKNDLSGLEYTAVSDISDHGELSGLLDDDHSQYHNDTRGDDRYLYKENTTVFIPDGDYEPTTKKYVDDSISYITASGILTTVSGESVQDSIDSLKYNQHDQNTDVGTNSSTFQLDVDNSGVKIKNNLGTLEIRNSIDSNYSKAIASDFTIEDMHLESSTYSSLNDFFNLFTSAGRISGGAISDTGSSTFAVASGTGLIRVADDDVSQVKFFNWVSLTNNVINTNEIKYIGVDYNSGSPSVVIKETDSWDLDTNFPLGRVINIEGNLEILNNPWWVSDGLTNILQRFQADAGYVSRDKIIGGLIISESGDGNRNIRLTAGRLWSRFNKYDVAAFDSSEIGDTFDILYPDGSGGWNMSVDVAAWDNANYYDYTSDTGNLSSVTNNKYSVLWFYYCVHGKIKMLYGAAEYPSSSSAENEAPPNVLPPCIEETGILLGRVISQQGNNIAIEVQSSFTGSFTAAQAADHGNLTGLTDDDHPQYFNTTRGDIRYYTKDQVSVISGSLQDNIDNVNEIINQGFQFTDLTDTPTTYSGSEGKYLKVTASGIEFADVTTSGGGASDIQSFLDLEDTHSSYDTDKYLRSTSSGIEFIDLDSQITTVSGYLQNQINSLNNTYYYSESNSESGYTLSTTYLTKTYLTVGSGITGKFRLGYAMDVQMQQDKDDVYVRFYNDTDAVVLSEMNPSLFTIDSFIVFSGFAIVSFTGSEKTFKLEYRANGTACNVRNARIEAWRVE